MRYKNTGDAKINQDGTKMANNGEDWTGLLMTTKYKFGKKEKRQRYNNQAGRNKDS